jgi:urease accessory protein
MLRTDLRDELSEPEADRTEPAHAAEPTRLQRAWGFVELEVGVRAGASALLVHREAGCSKARFPKSLDPRLFEAVLINAAGGIAGGDRIEQRLRVRAGARLLASGQAAEKVYRSLGPEAHLETRLEVEPGGTLLWLPQETILFDGARLDRTLEVELAGEARFLLVEALVLGRTARGERVRTGALRDRRVLRREGELLLVDPFRLEGPIAELAERPALLGGARAFATLFALGPGIDEDRLQAVRGRLAEVPARAAAGLRGPVLVARLLAADGFVLRRALASALEPLLPAFGLESGLPRVWRC